MSKKNSSKSKPRKTKLATPQLHWNGSAVSAKRPGCVALILEMLDAASAKSPVTKKAICERLALAFPDRDPSKMSATVSTMTTWLVLERKRVIRGVRISESSNERGYYVDAKETARLVKTDKSEKFVVKA